jgi:hypothetical protein
MTGSETKQNMPASTSYEAPRFQRHCLATITLGGSPGAGDSGAPTEENPFGGSTGFRGSRDDESFEEGWDNDV